MKPDAPPTSKMGFKVDADTRAVLQRAVGNPMIRFSSKTRDHLVTKNTGWERVDEKNVITLAALAGCVAVHLQEQLKVPVGILLRSSWQTVNIGDIAHTPGVLTILEKHLPDAKLYLWPIKIDIGVDPMLRKRFPKLVIVQSADEVRKAFEDCDFLLHGSGPYLVAEPDVKRWVKETGKPFGVYGITLGTMIGPAVGKQTVDLLNRAAFVYFRDSVSLQFAKDKGVECPVMEFGPDGAFATDLRDDPPAVEFLRANGLEEGKFLCCISRYRHTPYWKTAKKSPFDPKKHARNEEMKENDHAPLRDAICAVVRETPMKALLCPEDSSQMEITKVMLYDRLPDDVKAKAVWRDKYWLTDEALSTYVRSAGMFASEMHSPIMCIGNGIPAIVCRWKEQTSKGLMWRDIGLGDWLFDFDKPAEAARLAPAVLAMAEDPAAAKAKAAKARAVVEQHQKRTMAELSRHLGA